MNINEIIENSKTILTQTKSRCSQDPETYKCIDDDGHVKGRCNVFRLTIPQIIRIDKRIQSGETITKISEDYPISSRSMTETMKKYYCGLFEPAIGQYYRRHGDG